MTMHAGSAAQVLLAWDDPERLSVELMGSRFDAATLSGGAAARLGALQRRAGGRCGVGERPGPRPSGRVLAAVSVSGPAERFGRHPGRRHADAVLATAAAFTAALTPPREGPRTREEAPGR